VFLKKIALPLAFIEVFGFGFSCVFHFSVGRNIRVTVSHKFKFGIDVQYCRIIMGCESITTTKHAIVLSQHKHAPQNY
jgi:hypothetical protein